MLNFWKESFNACGHKYMMKCFRMRDGSVRRFYYCDGIRTKRQIVINAYMSRLDKTEKTEYNEK